MNNWSPTENSYKWPFHGSCVDQTNRIHQRRDKRSQFRYSLCDRSSNKYRGCLNNRCQHGNYLYLEKSFWQKTALAKKVCQVKISSLTYIRSNHHIVNLNPYGRLCTRTRMIRQYSHSEHRCGRYQFRPYRACLCSLPFCTRFGKPFLAFVNVFTVADSTAAESISTWQQTKT